MISMGRGGIGSYRSSVPLKVAGRGRTRRRGLLQGLSVRAVLDPDGAETGMYEIPAGGRRYRALELLVKQKRMAKTQPVPCVVRTEGLAEEDSLAENVQRVALHPLEQFRAFQTLRGQGLGEEDIAARFFVSPAVVKQRLKLAAACASPGSDGARSDGLARELQRWRGANHPAAGRRECARTDSVQFSQSLFSLSARHAGQTFVWARVPRL
jgi:hypothetical protein